MNDHLFGVLWSLWENRAQNEWVFCNSKTGDLYKARPKMMRGLCKRAGIEPYFGFHALRHFMTSFLADKKKWSSKTIQKLLRHQEQWTTEIYLHSIGEGMADAMRDVGDFLNGNGHEIDDAVKAISGK